LSKVLGKGATGQVYRGSNSFNVGYHHKTHEPVAVKAIQMTQINNEVTHYLLEGEKKAMTTIKNPYVVKTHEIIQ
jgi:serine/threonine protein kinase